MKTIIASLLCLCLSAGNVLLAQQQEELSNLLQQEKYSELVNKVCLLREKEYYKSAFMDYCLAYSYCRLGESSLSSEWFDHILASYNSLSQNKRNELKELKQNCTNTGTASGSAGAALFGFLNGMSAEGFAGSASAGIESKMGIPSISDTVEEFDFEHLTFNTQNRKFTQQQKKEALAYYRGLLADKTIKADTTIHFLVFYPGSATAIKDHIKQLEEYYSYYNSSFNLQESDRLITVFYCTGRTEFNETAFRVHNIPVPKSTYGYASSIDLVMLGIANAAWLGAMKHELFHLMIRSYVGDIPPWLDEGTASFFESSTLKKGLITTNLSHSNYRVSLLQNCRVVKHEIKNRLQKEFMLPSLQELVNFNWQEFSGRPGDLTIKASFNQSLSYAFAAYLYEQNLLPEMIEAFRHRSFTETSPEGTHDLILLHLKTNEELLMKVTGMNMPEIQTAFIEWCRGENIDIE